MNTRKARVLGVVLLAAFVVAVAGVALAQENSAASPGNLPKIFWSKLAAALGIDESKLQEAVKSAASQTIDEGIQQGILPEERAQELRECLEKGIWPAPLGGFGGFRGFRGGFGFEVADLLGMSPQELRQELQSGKTLQEIAAAKGLSLDQLRQQWLARKKAELQELVSQGKLTQEKADEILSRLEKVDLNHCPFPGPKAGVDGERGRNL